MNFSSVGCGFQARSCLLRSWRGCRRCARNNRLGGNSLLDCVVFGRVVGVACAQYMLGDRAKATSLAALAGGGKGEGSKRRPGQSGRTFTSGLRGLRPRGRRSMCQVREEEEEMDFTIIKPVIHTGGLENDEKFDCMFYFLPQSDLGNALRSAASLRCLITPVIQCGLFWTLTRIRVCWVWV